MIIRLIALLIALLFVGCSQHQPRVEQHKIDIKMPFKAPLSEEQILDDKNYITTIGIAKKRVDNNIYMQRVLALGNARDQMSKIIHTKVNSMLKSNKSFNNQQSDISFTKEIQATSNSVLKNVVQKELHVDEKGTMYITLSLYKKEISLDSYETINDFKNFDKSALMNSKCYSKKILSTLATKERFKGEYPLWYYRPNMYGKLGGVGISGKTKKGIKKQKRLAYMLAINDIAKNSKIKIDTKEELKQTLKNEELKTEYHSDSYQKSSLHVKGQVKDVFFDPDSCVLYMLVLNK